MNPQRIGQKIWNKAGDQRTCDFRINKIIFFRKPFIHKRFGKIVNAEEKRMEQRCSQNCHLISTIHPLHAFFLIYGGESVKKAIIFVFAVFCDLHKVETGTSYIQWGTYGDSDETRDEAWEKIDFDLGFVVDVFVHWRYFWAWRGIFVDNFIDIGGILRKS